MGDPGKLSGRIIAIIGSASGIGAETARRCAGYGATVFLADIDEQGLTQVVEEINDSGGRTAWLPVDVSDAASIERVAEHCIRTFGRVDVVVNCAAILIPGPMGRISGNQAARQVEINLLGTIYTSQAFLPRFEAQNSGHLINISSLGGLAPLPSSAVYGATKAGVRNFSLALALEYRRTPIRVSVICPDSVDTPQLAAEALGEGSTLSFTSEPLQPADIADIIIQTILRPRREVLVPRHRGWITKLADIAPGLMARLYPLLDRSGTERRKAYSRQVQKGVGIEESAAPVKGA